MTKTEAKRNGFLRKYLMAMTGTGISLDQGEI